ncbi:hypothetical protein VHEMI03315 [[Torrubiella] hemipterigena]|uniref:NAD(P)-binding domain-containing protein n=1 Tax=[Torrubiella] hemipterigena TaxID=1531966 RepID=A0A0A1TD30_9HYPO|nr:hypothetical protein VHEMI03315 [[Torrubiella] hemipterigena]
MKIIVTGATGLVGQAIIRQCLSHKGVESVVAVARKPISIDDVGDTTKLKSVVVQDYEEYPAAIIAEFADADVCIWTVAVTPFRTGNLAADEIKRVCQTCTIAGFKAMYNGPTKKPFRFIYFSAEGTPTDLSKKPHVMGDYQIMRGETEKMVLNLPQQYPDSSICIVHPGVVTAPTSVVRSMASAAFSFTNLFTRAFANISREQLAASVIELAVAGFTKSSYTNNELVEIGSKALQT